MASNPYECAFYCINLVSSKLSIEMGCTNNWINTNNCVWFVDRVARSVLNGMWSNNNDMIFVSGQNECGWWLFIFISVNISNNFYTHIFAMRCAYTSIKHINFMCFNLCMWRSLLLAVIRMYSIIRTKIQPTFQINQKCHHSDEWLWCIFITADLLERFLFPFFFFLFLILILNNNNNVCIIITSRNQINEKKICTFSWCARSTH